jgi:Kyanoviridae head maturation protease
MKNNNVMILTESFFDIVSESFDDNKKMKLRGVFMEAQTQNRNGRKYQKKEIQAAVNKINEAASTGHHILGSLDHPPVLEVKLDTVSHKINEMHMEGNKAIGEAEILRTPSGNIARSLIDSGIKVGMSSRGTGMINEETGVVEGFECVTVDIVAQPSAINAYPASVLEHLDYYRNKNYLFDLAEAVNDDPKAQKYFKSEIDKFIEDLFNTK